jgi:hypothetical protein
LYNPFTASDVVHLDVGQLAQRTAPVECHDVSAVQADRDISILWFRAALGRGFGHGCGVEVLAAAETIRSFHGTGVPKKNAIHPTTGTATNSTLMPYCLCDNSLTLAVSIITVISSEKNIADWFMMSPP